MAQRFRKVRCSNCREPFYRDKGHFKENLKLGHNFYCSPGCLSEYKRTGKRLSCENGLCKKEFYRTKHAILQYNYCSQSCAATVNNYKFPKWPTRYCKICKKVVKRGGTPYCSIECGKIGRLRYTKEEILGFVRNYYDQTRRVPAKRELLEVSNKAANLFGSWNKTLIAAGLVPNRSHDHRMYKRMNTKALDGHLCDSISEAIVDNWLNKYHIPHIRGTRYPGANFRADWAIGDTFVEYFGLAKDSPRYDREIRRKRNFCRRHGINLIAIYPRDLYPAIILDNKFRALITKS